MKKTVLITGSSRGIGKAIAKTFATDQNYNIVINCNKDIKNLDAFEKELLEINKNVLSVQCDVSNYEDVKNMFLTISSHFKTDGVDILINNAGVSSIALFNTSDITDIYANINTNLMSVVNCSHIALQNMIKNKSGNIINISSIWGETGASMEVAYSTAKSGIIGFTKALAKENAPSNIRVNCISVGVIDTDMNKFLQSEERQAIEDEIPMGRFGTAKEVANLCEFLAEDSSSYITGQVLRIDGGYL